MTQTTPGWTARSYENGYDLVQMQDLLMAARLSTSDWRYAHVGDLLWGFFMVACHLDPHRQIRLWHNSEGRLVGYAILSEDPALDWQVIPAYTWAGIELEVIDWAERRLVDLRRQDKARWGDKLLCSAHQDDAKRIAFLEAHGFRTGEYVEVNMLRSLHQPITQDSLPPGCQVRAFTDGEISNRAAAQRAVWQPWTVGNVSDTDYARFMELPGYQRDLDVVAVTPDGVIAAYVNGWIDPVNRIGDFGPVGTLPEYRRQGLGRAVLTEGLRRMQARGMVRVCVSTGETNLPAQKLYISIGFKIVNKHLEYVKAA